MECEAALPSFFYCLGKDEERGVGEGKEDCGSIKGMVAGLTTCPFYPLRPLLSDI